MGLHFSFSLSSRGDFYYFFNGVSSFVTFKSFELVSVFWVVAINARYLNLFIRNVCFSWYFFSEI